MKKKLMSYLLTAVLAVSSLAGCGKGDVPQNAAVGGGQAKEEGRTDSQGQEASGEPKDFHDELPEDFTISIMLSDYEGSPNSGEYGEQIKGMIEEYTGYKLDIWWITSGNFNDKLSTVLAGGVDSMPMITKVGATNAVVISAAQNGAFQPIEDYVWDTGKFPYLSQMKPELANTFTINGHLYGTCCKGTIGRNGMGYRTDWAQKLGLDTPETVQDVYDMLYAFTYGDPDGNGKDDTYGLNLCSYTGSLDVMQSWFGCGSKWVIRDGEVVPVHMTEEYMEALNWFKKLYDDGLVAHDWPIRDTGTWRDDNNNGVAGMFVDTLDNSRRIWDYYVTNEIPSVMGDGQYASMTLVPGIAKDDSSQLHTMAAEQTTFFTVTKAAKTEAEVLACLEFLDKMNADDMKMLCGYGLEGIHWELGEGGEIVDLDEEDPQLKKGYAGLNQMLPNVTGGEMESYKITQTERVMVQNAAYAAAEEISVFNPALSYTSASQTYAANAGNLDLILEDARTQYIVGQIDEKGL